MGESPVAEVLLLVGVDDNISRASRLTSRGVAADDALPPAAEELFALFAIVLGGYVGTALGRAFLNTSTLRF